MAGTQPVTVEVDAKAIADTFRQVSHVKLYLLQDIS
jgi:hypothetical protein